MNSPKRLIPVVILVLSLIAVAIGAWMMVPDFLAAKAYEDLSVSVRPKAAVSINSEQGDAAPIDWEQAQEKVPNAIAWLTIEGTNIDLPVAQATAEDPEYWLSHDIMGNDSQSGTIFLDEQCKPSDKTLLFYGHKMNNRSMFHDLGEVFIQDNFNNLGTLTFDAYNLGITRFTPLAAGRIDAYDTDVRALPQMSESERLEWIKNFCETSGSKASNWSEIATIHKRYAICITCSGYVRYGHDARTVVVFVED